MVAVPFFLVLNGTSSAGKTTLAKALQAELPEPWLRCGYDDLLRLAPLERDDLYPSVDAVLPLLGGIHRAMAALAWAGSRVIADVVLQDAWMVEDFKTAISGLPLLWVAVRCPLEIAEQREARRERKPGLARSQYDRVHAHVTYDAEVDTSVSDVATCVQVVAHALDGVLGQSAVTTSDAELS
jgi:chloramphenicol 3-O phosphotransferase